MIEQYETCRLTLMQELGIAPMEDTQALYMQIITSGEGGGSLLLSGEQSTLVRALQQIREANQTIDLAKNQIRQALQLIDKILDGSA